MKQLPKMSWGKPADQQPIYFAHANGFPPTTYQPIIDALAEQRQVVSYLQRPLWQPTPSHNELTTWQQLADDVIVFFDQNKMKNVVAVGHSLGAVTAYMAAKKRPDLIKALVMIEPVTLPWFFCWLTRTFPAIVKKRVKIINKALGRPERFDNLKAAFEFHRKARAFKGISDKNLMHYIEAGFSHCTDGEFHLNYPREWEAQIYATATYFRGDLVGSKLPVMAMRGEHSDTIPVSFWNKWRGNQNHQFIDFSDNGHLLPLENPNAVIQSMLPFVQQHLA